MPHNLFIFLLNNLMTIQFTMITRLKKQSYTLDGNWKKLLTVYSSAMWVWFTPPKCLSKTD